MKNKRRLTEESELFRNRKFLSEEIDTHITGLVMNVDTHITGLVMNVYANLELTLFGFGPNVMRMTCSLEVSEIKKSRRPVVATGEIYQDSFLLYPSQVVTCDNFMLFLNTDYLSLARN
jgi:hypothetical protein